MFVSRSMYMGALRKNLTYFDPLIRFGMPDKKKQEYYKNNKKKRLEYQRKYYERNKERILTSRERKRSEDPEWAKEQKDYNREYYLKNKERIMAKRRARKELMANRS